VRKVNIGLAGKNFRGLGDFFLMDIIYLTFDGLHCLEQYSLGGSMWARGEKDFSEAKKTTPRRAWSN
jgi:hypothetical protein